MCCDTSYWVIICHASLRYRSFATKRKIEFVKKSARAEKRNREIGSFFCYGDEENATCLSSWNGQQAIPFRPIFICKAQSRICICDPYFSCITFFSVLGKGMGSLFREFVIGADSFGQLSSGIPNRILSGLMYWLIVAIVMGILFIITGLLIVGIGYQVGKIYRKYCWNILSIIVAITSTAIVIYFGEWIKNAIPINLMVFLLLSHVIYIYFRANIYYHISMKGESI